LKRKSRVNNPRKRLNLAAYGGQKG